jgi:transposase
MQQDLTRLLGLEGVAVIAVRERDEVVELEVELERGAGVCPRCGRASVTVKERPVVRIRDLPIAGRRTHLCWRKRRFDCGGCGRSFTETHQELPGRQRVTGRFRRRLYEQACAGGAHAEIARGEQTTRYQVGRAFALGAAGELAARGAPLPRRLSLDEAHHRRGRELVTVVSDLDRRCVLEVLDGRSRRLVERYLRSLTPAQHAAIDVVAIDAHDPYRRAVRTVLPHARLVCDPFHLVRGANHALDTVRRQRQRFRRRQRPVSSAQRRDGYRPELWRARRRLLKGGERLGEHERRTLCELFAAEPLVAEAWGLKERFRAIYRADDRADAEQRLDAFEAAVERAALPSFTAFANGLRPWRAELLAYFDEPTTNGYAEGVINKIKVIKRRAYGLRNFTSFRARILVACS